MAKKQKVLAQKVWMEMPIDRPYRRETDKPMKAKWGKPKKAKK